MSQSKLVNLTGQPVVLAGLNGRSVITLPVEQPPAMVLLVDPQMENPPLEFGIHVEGDVVYVQDMRARIVGLPDYDPAKQTAGVRYVVSNDVIAHCADRVDLLSLGALTHVKVDGEMVLAHQSLVRTWYADKVR